MKTTILFILTISFNTVFAQENGASHELVKTDGNFLQLSRIEVIPITDTQTGRQYELYVKLPESYAEDTKSQHPVIYYTDAMWHVEILSGAAEYIIEDAILVGISWQKDINESLMKEVGEHASRYRDYTIRESSKPEHQAKYQFGQASNHLDFIRNDVIKYVENNYRTDSNNRTYFGYSASGLFGAYILLAQPDTFKNYILGSPSLERNIPQLSQLKSKEVINANVFISNGSLEEELGRHVTEFITLLKNRNDKRLSLHHVVIEGSHQSAFPMTGVSSVTWLSGLSRE